MLRCPSRFQSSLPAVRAPSNTSVKASLKAQPARYSPPRYFISANSPSSRQNPTFANAEFWFDSQRRLPPPPPMRAPPKLPDEYRDIPPLDCIVLREVVLWLPAERAALSRFSWLVELVLDGRVDAAGVWDGRSAPPAPEGSCDGRSPPLT